MRGLVYRRIEFGCLALALFLFLISAPTASGQSKSTADIAATFWAGTDSDGGTFVFEFAQSGKFRYVPGTGVLSTGRWKQLGDAVEMEINGKFVRFSGMIVDEHLKGKASTKQGLKWAWSAEKQPPVVSSAAPTYPPIANAARASGPVVVELRISAAGEVASARAVSGHPLLQQASVIAGRLWRFARTVESDKVRVARIVFTFRNPNNSGDTKKLGGPHFLSPYQAFINPYPVSVEVNYSSARSK